jgi:hypothetical protein
MHDFDASASSAVATIDGHERTTAGPLSPMLFDQMQCARVGG